MGERLSKSPKSSLHIKSPAWLPLRSQEECGEDGGDEEREISARQGEEVRVGHHRDSGEEGLE